MSGRKGEQKRKWSQADMDQALEEVRSNKMTASEASRVFKVPRKTLTDRIQNKVKDNCKAGGPPTILSEEHELSLCSYIEYMATRGFPLTISQILMYAWCLDKRGKTNSVRMAHVTLGGWDSSEDTQKVSSFANPTVWIVVEPSSLQLIT